MVWRIMLNDILQLQYNSGYNNFMEIGRFLQNLSSFCIIVALLFYVYIPAKCTKLHCKNTNKYLPVKICHLN